MAFNITRIKDSCALLMPKRDELWYNISLKDAA